MYLDRCASRPASLMCLSFSLVLVYAAFLTATASPQTTSPKTFAGVEQRRTGAYRALAELSFEAVQRRDNATAAKLARILEKTWDKGEGNSSENSIRALDRSVFEKIDQAMDIFIGPIMNYDHISLNIESVRANYNALLESFKPADELISRDNGVTRSRWGNYRALVEVSYWAFQKGDKQVAATTATVLRRVWTVQEERGGEESLGKTNPNLFKPIDLAMMDFVRLLEDSSRGNINEQDAGAVQTAYGKLLEQFKASDVRE